MVSTGCQRADNDVNSQYLPTVQFGYQLKSPSMAPTGRGFGTINETGVAPQEVVTASLKPTKVVVTIEKEADVLNEPTTETTKKTETTEEHSSLEPVYTDKKLIFDDGNSEMLPLPPGTYSLTHFKVLNGDGDLIYLSPREGSETAKYVDRPLPLKFVVKSDNKARVKPEVLSVSDYESQAELEGLKPSKSLLDVFGYPNFGYQVVGLTVFDMVVFKDYTSGALPFHLKISSTTKYKKDGGTESVSERVFIDKDLNAGTWRVRIPNTYAKFDIVVSDQADTSQKKIYNKELEWLQCHDNFHHPERSLAEQRIWTIYLYMNVDGSDDCDTD